ncbi:hypothetical protein SAMN02745857_03846 [Andreprevotia lacus DSM 23236]|jgi:hypothetical protein|uniref:Uncharacterized protein n=1 Tax=Andreprevotia lacus DSM 23236 TaxID=1121001 RepID=A0A1W1Y122_9NEIS|nr:hypothetical protein [Andreprevotia lacus]SMC29458.1 hypothetical protein SAMN02745857_03846 [Andreprevotia lacus DSM 23236]
MRLLHSALLLAALGLASNAPAFAAQSPLAEFVRCDSNFYRLLGSNPELVKNAELVSKNGLGNFKLGAIEGLTAEERALAPWAQEDTRYIDFKTPAQFADGIRVQYYAEHYFNSLKKGGDDTEESFGWRLMVEGKPKQVLAALGKSGAKLPWKCEDGICTVFRQQQGASWNVVARDQVADGKPYLVLMLSPHPSLPKSSDVECVLRMDGARVPKSALDSLRPNWW